MNLILSIEFETAVHHASGYGLAGIVDRSVLRDHRGLPYLAGSAIKGKFRHAGMRLLQALGGGCGTTTNPGICTEKAGRCPLCRAFGSRLFAGEIVFNDALPAEPERRILDALVRLGNSPVVPGGSHVRTSTAVDRATRTVRPQHLFSTETIPPLIRFECAIEGIGEQDVEFLQQCASLLTNFGAASARGLGYCQFVLPAAEPVEAISEGE